MKVFYGFGKSEGLTGRAKEHDGKPKEWRDIKGYEGVYLVSNYGEVRRIFKRNKKYLKPSISTTGRLAYRLSRNGKSVSFLAHRLVAEAFIPNPEGKPEVNHIDGDYTNNMAWNLEWCSRKENMAHAKENGLMSSGWSEEAYRNHWLSKFTLEQILNIRKCHKEYGVTAYRISKMLNVNEESISIILNSATWNINP